MARFILGSFAGELIRELRVPVLLVPGETAEQRRPPTLSKIVVPLDGSTLAEGALPFARRLATAGTDLVLVQAVAPVEGRLDTGGFIERATDEVATQRLEADAESYLAGVAQSLRQSGVRASHRVMRGRASSGVLDLARAASADMVVMMSHGLTGFQRWRLGSVADELVRDGTVPVFLVTRQAVASESPEGWLVRGFMREDVPAFRTDDSLSSVISMVTGWHAAEAPVVDNDGKLVGIVSARELLAWRLRNAEHDGSTVSGVVADVLTADSTTITDTATLGAAARVLVNQRLDSVVVTREGRPIGVVTIQDVLAGLGQVREDARPSSEMKLPAIS
jgi:nucleotide-binding universal stress UspA family protein/predicted transcriptional regulator